MPLDPIVAFAVTLMLSSAGVAYAFAMAAREKGARIRTRMGGR